ncbi:hypothetical protein SAMN02745172_02115 [Pseudoxanthobacter soli DSM 19599]|uniref:Uncharacterized protein n=1 Tax=Pseudoxanthobacter soli DSM 19599 TaxID=1123029 RepID=A0A1M7ZKN8_9HYPH|nr:hypothetical protein [Pseudoxanthobacter soli]SHO65470.1 hypothetical protein SAMN02745172_02115 [Pseudoxanthobacter soli DSM 19599]
MAEKPTVAWPIYKMFDQLDRYVVSFLLIHNYYAWRLEGGREPTLTALQAIVPSSPRHTAGFVAALKAGQFVVVEQNPADGREKWLRPAPAMVFEVGRSIRAFVACLDEIDGVQPARSLTLADVDALGGVLQRSAAFVLKSGTLIHAFPRVLHFAMRDCGYPLLTAVVGAHIAAVEPEAETVDIRLSLRALAERLQVSRAHVGNILDEAERAGWFTVRNGRLASFSEDLLVEFEEWACWEMTHYARMLGRDPFH